jgi:predicted transcriptional regulator
MKNFSIRLPEEQRQAIAKIAAANSLKESDVMRLAVRHYLKALKRRKA